MERVSDGSVPVSQCLLSSIKAVDWSSTSRPQTSRTRRRCFLREAGRSLGRLRGKIVKWTSEQWIEYLMNRNDKQQFECCSDRFVTTNNYELLKIIPAESGSIQSCRNPVQTPFGWTDYISHVGSIWNFRSIVDAGLIA